MCPPRTRTQYGEDDCTSSGDNPSRREKQTCAFPPWVQQEFLKECLIGIFRLPAVTPFVGSRPVLRCLGLVLDDVDDIRYQYRLIELTEVDGLTTHRPHHLLQERKNKVGFFVMIGTLDLLFDSPQQLGRSFWRGLKQLLIECHDRDGVSAVVAFVPATGV